jgi:UPF0271 protein
MDLNCDMGESFGRWRLGHDAELLEIVTSANIACGYHAGDPLSITAVVREAVERGVALGAHPSYPDLSGFGRRSMRMAPAEVEAMVLYQIGALDAIVRAAGSRLRHVKPHGALYNDAARDEALARAIASAVARYGDLRLFALPNSALAHAAADAGVPTWREAFCDRAYEDDGSLRSRRLAGALVQDPEAAARQALDVAVHRRVRTYSGATMAMEAETLCVHGDTPGAVDIARSVRTALERAGVRVSAAA